MTKIKNITETEVFDLKKLTLMHKLIRAIKHPLRRQMMGIMKDEGRITVTELFIKLRLEQSVVSQHLAILRAVGVLETTRDGKYMYYGINEAKVASINELLNGI